MSGGTGVATTTSRYARSKQLFEEAQQYLAGGNSRLTIYYQPHPIYAARGEGARMVDVDGNEYIDFINNYTSMIHGYAHPDIQAAVVAAYGGGSAFAAPTEAEVALARELCQRIPSVDRLRFTNSGTEAVMMALKAARAYSGKPVIAKFEGAYHGAYDFVEVSLSSSPDNWGDLAEPAHVPYSKGTPQSLLDEAVVLPYNQIDETVALLRANQDRLAAVIIDVMPSRIGLIPVSPEFIERLQAECRALGILLIQDEVISFRLGYHGSQENLPIEPDLLTLGKIIGGGFPVGAVGGKRDVMSVFDATGGKPAVPHGGTFNGNPVTMAAGMKSMELLPREEIERLNGLGEALRADLGDLFGSLGADWQVTGAGSLFRLMPTSAPMTDYRSAHPTPEQAKRVAALHWALSDRGIFIGSGLLGCLSTPMSEAEIGTLVRAVEDAVRAVGG